MSEASAKDERKKSESTLKEIGRKYQGSREEARRKLGEDEN